MAIRKDNTCSTCKHHISDDEFCQYCEVHSLRYKCQQLRAEVGRLQKILDDQFTAKRGEVDEYD